MNIRKILNIRGFSTKKPNQKKGFINEFGVIVHKHAMSNVMAYYHYQLIPMNDKLSIEDLNKWFDKIDYLIENDNHYVFTPGIIDVLNSLTQLCENNKSYPDIYNRITQIYTKINKNIFRERPVFKPVYIETSRFIFPSHI